MVPNTSLWQNITADIFRATLDQLEGDYATLCRATLVCRCWRHLVTPVLLWYVGLSCHNLERHCEHERACCP